MQCFAERVFETVVLGEFLSQRSYQYSKVYLKYFYSDRKRNIRYLLLFIPCHKCMKSTRNQKEVFFCPHVLSPKSLNEFSLNLVLG
jgi:hypothetical protein